MRQVYHPYWKLEEHQHGMWRQVTGGGNRLQHATNAANLMRDPEAFKESMLKAVRTWSNSCEAALTTPGLNRRAWLGHAGCCIGVGSPEELTRLGWHMLSREEQDAANAAADEAIFEWERLYLLGPDQGVLFDA